MTAPSGAGAAVWVSVLPDLSNFGAAFVRDVAGVGGQAGDRVGRDMAEHTESSFSKGAKAVAAAGAAIGVALGAALVGAMNVEAANDKLSAQLGLSAQDAERYGKIAGGLYSANYGDSLETVNEALRQVTLNVGGTATASDDSLRSITASVLDVATAFDQDLGGTAAAVGQLMKTGLAPDATSALDLITVGFQKGADKAGDFLDTLNEYGTQFRKLGIDGEMATGILSQGLQAGARDADLVADALKEFSIRAIDGSKLTGEGFKALGLDGEKMGTLIAAGGDKAGEALDVTLDALRAMPDPVARSAAATALFGTQAEDLGAALFALDPSSAVAALGQVEGAAGRMGATMADNAGANLESFKRQVMTAFVDIVGGQILPIVTRFASFLATTFGPALGVLVGILSSVVTAFAEFGGWIQRNREWIEPLAIGIGVFTLAVNASAIATAAWGLATAAASAIMGIVRGAVLAFQVSVWLLNAALAANPIGLVVALVAGLVAALIYAWNNSETFRNIVIGAWEAIKNAAAVVFGAIGQFLGVLGQVAATVWNAIVTGITEVGNFFTWLWGVVSPVLSAIGEVVRVVAAVILTIFIAPVVLAINLLGALFGWLYAEAIKPALDAIAVAAQWVWSSILQPVFAAITAALNALGAFFRWVYDTLIKPALDAVGTAAQWLWANVLQPVFAAIQAGLTALGDFFRWTHENLIRPALQGIQAASEFLGSALAAVFSAIQSGLRAVGDFFTWVYQNVIKPALDGIGQAATFVWNSVLKPAFDAIGVAVRAVGDAFGWAVDKIGEVWGRIQAIVKPPIEFVVNVVYNNGIRPAWNFIAGLFGLGTLPELHFARGGLVPGRDTGRDYVPAMLRGGEGVLVPGAVQAIGGPGALDALNRKAEGRPAGKARNGDWGYLGDWRNGRQHFAEGGIAGWLWDTVGAVGDFVGGIVDFIADPAAAVRKVFAGIDTSGVGGAGQLSEAMMSIPGRAIDAAIDWVKKLISENAGAADGPGLAAALSWARTQAGKPYVWGGGGNPGWDCSGFIGGVTNVARGQAPGRIGTTFTMPWSGFAPGTNGAFVVGNTNSGVGHMAATLMGTNIETRGGDGTVIGGSARGAMDGLFDEHYVFQMDQGGMLPPGWSSIFNGTGKPEPVLTNDQWAQIRAGGMGGEIGEKLDRLIAEVQKMRPITVEDRSGNPVETARAMQLALRVS